jgi:predicted Rdx family selenoprotein
MFKNWTPEDILTAVALIGAGIAFVFGLLQYRKGQQWKRAEWVAQEMKQLFADPLVQATLLMIDWGKREVRLYPERKKESDQYVFVTATEVTAALLSHRVREGIFTAQEARIRDAFDRFLDGLERFNSYEQTKLVSIDDVHPYLKYWADRICAEPSNDRLTQLKEYMNTYGYSGAYALLRKIATR